MRHEGKDFKIQQPESLQFVVRAGKDTYSPLASFFWRTDAVAYVENYQRQNPSSKPIIVDQKEFIDRERSAFLKLFVLRTTLQEILELEEGAEQ
jgi:hypothetical protein